MQQVTRSMAHSMPEVRLVGEGFNEIVKISEAFKKAEELGLDLILVGDKSNPPVVKISDYKKIQYEAKKAKSKQTKGADLKEIQLKVNITDHDLATKIAAINRFIARGDKVKVSVRLKGRERDAPERAFQLLEKAVSQVQCRVSKVPGPMAIALLEPGKPEGTEQKTEKAAPQTGQQPAYTAAATK